MTLTPDIGDACCTSGNRPCQVHNKPGSFTITATAEATHEPTSVTYTVTLKGKDKNRRTALERLQEEIEKLIHCLGPEIDVSFAPPQELSGAEGEGRRETKWTMVSTTGKFQLGEENFGSVFVALAEAGFRVGDPAYEFAQDLQPGATLHKEAAAFALEKAKATAAGGGFLLGDVVGVSFSDVASDQLFRPLLETNMVRSSPVLFSHFNMFRSQADPEPVVKLNPGVFEMLHQKVPVKTTTVVVGLTIEILPAA